VLNTTRHAAALRPFRKEEFGKEQSSPSEAHIQATNQMISTLQKLLARYAAELNRSALEAGANPKPAQIQRVLAQKDRSGQLVKFVEKVWDFFLELFGQRQSQLGNWLMATDRIALDCYQAIYTGLGAPRSIPSPPPFSYMATGFTPSTFRRGVPLSRLGDLANPFPIIQLPYHRLVNPWTLGAVHHEVSHNIQNDLGLWNVVPVRLRQRLIQEGLPPAVAAVWARWHKEIWADLCGLLLGGPAVVASLVDVVGGSPRITLRYNATGVHPTSYLRTLISVELLRRMGFVREASNFRQMWQHMYPNPRQGNIPRPLLETFNRANFLVVDTICYQPYPQFGGKSLAQVTSFTQNHQKMTEEAAGRLSAGNDPGIIPARFLVGASRWATDHRMASPDRITHNFYQALIDR